MRAFILAAGAGSRLGSITAHCPKCILPVGNKSMLEHWFFLFGLYGIKEVLINTHYLSDKVVAHCSKIISNCERITFSYEKELLGTAKTIFCNRDFVKNDRYFLIVYADTWMNLDIGSMINFQKKRKGMGTLGLYKPNNLLDQGVIELNGRKIISIEEKVVKPKGTHAFAGIMIGSYSMFKFYNESMFDLVRDWLPVVKNGLNPYFIDGLVLDIGTPERYKNACNKIGNLGLGAL